MNFPTEKTGIYRSGNRKGSEHHWFQSQPCGTTKNCRSDERRIGKNQRAITKRSLK